MVHVASGNAPQNPRQLTHAHNLMHPPRQQPQNRAGLWLTFAA
jgi:hypothetical protein